MPPSPPPCQDENEAGHESNNSTTSAPQSPQTTDERGEASSEQNAMIDVMGGSTRLVSSRAGHADDGQALRNALPPPTGKNTTEMYCSRSSKNSHHVAESVLDRINDITSNNTAETESPPILFRGESTREQLRPPTATISSEAESASTSISPHQTTTSRAQLTQPLTSELLQASINAAVASVAPQQRQATTTATNRTEETHPEESAMSVDKLVPCKKPRRKRAPQVKSGQSAGRWTHKEHQAFMEGLRECGREWKKVATLIPTRTSAQIRSHAQKYFAKLQRYHDSMVQPDANHHNAVSAAIPTEGSLQQMSSSVQHNVDRILSNPNGAQREVENTLDALRERYRQLQRRLEQSQQRRIDATSARLVEDDPLHSTHRRKRALEELVDNNRVPPNDDHSSVSSAVSASVASLGDDELVALHVLGGGLPLGDGSSTDGAVRDVPLPGANYGSDTSIASNEEDDDQSAEPGEAKRRRKEG